MKLVTGTLQALSNVISFYSLLVAGDENAQLLQKIEHLKHVEEHSAVVYRDIENFKLVCASRILLLS